MPKIRNLKKLLGIIFIFLLCLTIREIKADIVGEGLEVTEEDGTPSTFPYKVKFPNTSLTDNGDETTSISFSTAGGWTDDGTAVRLTTSTDSVGIGTATPSESLEVVGDIKITDDTPHLEFEDSTTGHDDFEFYADGSQFYLQDLTGGGELFRFDGSNNFWLNNAYKFPSTDGTAGQTLSTNGVGVLSFSSAGAGDVTGVGDCTDGACLDGTSDGGTWIKFYDAQGAGQLITGNLTGVQTWTLPDATGTVAVSATTPVTLSATGDIGITVAKDIVTTTPLTGGEDNVLPGADADLTLAITIAKDIVAGVGLSGGEDNVLPGADADTTLTLDLTEVSSLTWGSGTFTTMTFDAGVTDPVITASSGDLAVSTGTFTLLNTGLHLLDSNASHDLIIKPGSDLTADKTLTLTTGDADRTVTINADSTISGTNTGDNTVATTGDSATSFFSTGVLEVTIGGSGTTTSTGTGSVVLSNTPTLVTPVIGAATGTSLTTSGLIQTGQAGTDGQVKIYSEQGATDYSVVINPHAAMTQDVTFTLPADDGTASQFLQTDGAGALTFATVTAGDMSYANTRFAIEQFTRDISLASGTQAVTGVGFQPKSVIFHWAESGQTGNSGIGFDNGTTRNSTFSYHNATADTWGTSAANTIAIYEGASTDYVGYISSMDADGFTITWTKEGSPSGTVNISYLAFK